MHSSRSTLASLHVSVLRGGRARRRRRNGSTYQAGQALLSGVEGVVPQQERRMDGGAYDGLGA